MGKRLNHPAFGHGAVFVHQLHEFALLDCATLHPSNHDAAQVLVVIQVGHDHLKRCVDVHGWGWAVLEHHIKQFVEIILRIFQVFVSLAFSRDAVKYREIQLLVGCTEFGHQVKSQVDHLVRASVLTVNLVNHHDGAQSQLERLTQHETGLGHRAFSGINEEQAAVYHTEYALHFSTEIGVSGGIYDVDFDALVLHCGVLGQNSDAALPLKGVAIHRPLHEFLTVCLNRGLLEKPVYQGSFTVVYVGDDGDIAVFHEFS